MAKARFGKYSMPLPGNRIVRMGLGIVLIAFGLVGFLPVVGFWMVPLGFIVLATDIPAVRRFNRRVHVAFARWWASRKSKRAT